MAIILIFVVGSFGGALGFLAHLFGTRLKALSWLPSSLVAGLLASTSAISSHIGLTHFEERIHRQVMLDEIQRIRTDHPECLRLPACAELRNSAVGIAWTIAGETLPPPQAGRALELRRPPADLIELSRTGPAIVSRQIGVTEFEDWIVTGHTIFRSVNPTR